VSAKVKVVTTLPTYASIAREIGGDKVEVDHIAEPNQNPHFVQPKPSYALKLRNADLFVATGLDLELWVPPVIDKSGNPKVREGERGYVSVATGLRLLEVPETGTTRAEGDIHLFGNPHIGTGPLNTVGIARNICVGLSRVDPANAAFYKQRLEQFDDRLYRALFGDSLVDLIGGRKLATALSKGKLHTLLDDPRLNSLAGSPPLRERLGGWLRKAAPLRGKQIITYHKTWIYFTQTFGLEVVDNVEPKPGVPPSARRVSQLMDLIQNHEIEALIVASYFEKGTPAKIEAKTGAKAVTLTLDVYGEEGIDDYIALVDLWLDRLLEAYAS
jgi:ABC-type Zn uptake system ZnuABC Zn-binding protein ZnuA